MTDFTIMKYAMTVLKNRMDYVYTFKAYSSKTYFRKSS